MHCVNRSYKIKVQVEGFQTPPIWTQLLLFSFTYFLINQKLRTGTFGIQTFPCVAFVIVAAAKNSRSSMDQEFKYVNCKWIRKDPRGECAFNDAHLKINFNHHTQKCWGFFCFWFFCNSHTKCNLFSTHHVPICMTDYEMEYFYFFVLSFFT